MISSATWDAIHVDYGNAFSQIGPANLPYINGALLARYFINFAGANFAAASGTDIATFAITLPSGVTNYSVAGLRIGKAAATLGGVGVTLYTAPSAGGTLVMASTSTTVTSATANAANSYQVMTPPQTVMTTGGNLYLHVTVSTGTTSSTADVQLEIVPIY